MPAPTGTPGRETVSLMEASWRIGEPYRRALDLVLTRRIEGEKRGSRWVVFRDSLESYARAKAEQSVGPGPGR